MSRTLIERTNIVAPDVMSARCASRTYLALATSKWSILVVNALKNGSLRNGELLRAVEGISQKMLTQTLRQLETMSMVSREDMQTIPPHVQYELTELGESFREQAYAFICWVEEHVPQLKGL